MFLSAGHSVSIRSSPAERDKFFRIIMFSAVVGAKRRNMMLKMFLEMRSKFAGNSLAGVIHSKAKKTTITEIKGRKKKPGQKYLACVM